MHILLCGDVVQKMQLPHDFSSHEGLSLSCDRGVIHQLEFYALTLNVNWINWSRSGVLPGKGFLLRTKKASSLEEDLEPH